MFRSAKSKGDVVPKAALRGARCRGLRQTLGGKSNIQQIVAFAASGQAEPAARVPVQSSKQWHSGRESEAVAYPSLRRLPLLHAGIETNKWPSLTKQIMSNVHMGSSGSVVVVVAASVAAPPGAGAGAATAATAAAVAVAQ